MLLSREHGYQYFESQAGIGIAEAHLLDSAAEEAHRVAGDAADVAARNAFRAPHGEALMVQAKAAIALGDQATAAKHCGDAEALLRAANLPGQIRDCAALQTRIENLSLAPLPGGVR